MEKEHQPNKEYSLHKPILGVYQIKNKMNGKVLVEGSLNIGAQWRKHQSELKKGIHNNKSLQKDWNEQNGDNFIFEILVQLEYEEEDNVDYGQEVKILESLILEEFGIPVANRY